MSLRVEEINSFAEIMALNDRWDELLHTSGEDSFFLSIPWLKAWWETFGTEYKLKCIKVTEDEKVVGIAPFAIASRGKLISWKKLILLGSGPSDRCGIIAEKERADIHSRVWEYIKSTDEWDVIEIRDVDASGPTYRNFILSFPSSSYVTERSPYIDISKGYEGYVIGLSKNMRYNLGRYARKIESAGGKLVTRSGRDCCVSGIKMLKKLSNARWEGDNVLKSPKMMEFAERASMIRSDSANVVFHSIEIDDEAIAVSMGFEEKNRYMYYLSGFDPEYSKLSPGYVLISEIIKQCCSKKIKEVDMLRGTEEYKYRFNAVDRIQATAKVVNCGWLRNLESRVREENLI